MGSSRKTEEMMEELAGIDRACRVWPARRASIGGLQLREEVNRNVVAIMEIEMTELYAALELAGCSAGSICDRWVEQCFWSVLPLDGIIMFVCLGLSSGPQWQAMFVLAV